MIQLYMIHMYLCRSHHEIQQHNYNYSVIVNHLVISNLNHMILHLHHNLYNMIQLSRYYMNQHHLVQHNLIHIHMLDHYYYLMVIRFLYHMLLVNYHLDNMNSLDNLFVIIGQQNKGLVSQIHPANKAMSVFIGLH
jgi:hypothetical protein